MPRSYAELDFNEELSTLTAPLVYQPIVLGIDDNATGTIGDYFIQPIGSKAIQDASDRIIPTTAIGATYTFTAPEYLDAESYAFSIDGQTVGTDPLSDRSVKHTFTFVATNETTSRRRRR